MTATGDRAAVAVQAERILAIDGLRPRMRVTGPSGQRYVVQPTPDSRHPLMLMSGGTMIHNPSTRFQRLSGLVHGRPSADVDHAFLSDAAAIAADLTEQSLTTRGTEWAALRRRRALTDSRAHVDVIRQQARDARTATAERPSRGM